MKSISPDSITHSRTTDEAGLLQRAHAAQAGRRGNADAARQFDIGHAPVGLQFAQDGPVDTVELDPGWRLTPCAHASPLFMLGLPPASG
jgi:hypothetical protein